MAAMGMHDDCGDVLVDTEGNERVNQYQSQLKAFSNRDMPFYFSNTIFEHSHDRINNEIIWCTE